MKNTDPDRIFLDGTWTLFYAEDKALEKGETYPTAEALRSALTASRIKVPFGEEPDSLERFSKMSQISQAEAMKFFVKRFRGAKWNGKPTESKKTQNRK